MTVRESHYMPRACTPRMSNWNTSQVGGVREIVEDNEIVMYLLCDDCEQRFSQRGESEVLKHIAAKIAKKPMLFLERFTAASGA